MSFLSDDALDTPTNPRPSSEESTAGKSPVTPPCAAPDRHGALRQIPSVDELLAAPLLAELVARGNRALLVDAARAVLERRREAIAAGPRETVLPSRDALAQAVHREIAHILEPSLRRVINATGVILHTNLGRAPLSLAAIERIRNTAGGYTNLEYDLETGARGRRDVHTATLLGRLTGAEASAIVNNNAAAVFLVLASLARGGEVVVSRGELIEIGESFRIPDIMEESGAVLREVGTTNRTTLSDYERALSERTRLLLRVHRSNFHIVGFTARPSLGELVALGRRAGVPVYEDLGSGCLTDISGSAGAPSTLPGASGAVEAEPTVRASVDAGIDIVSFSGDKLLGGPQAGIILGRGELVARVRRHPLFRALRVDKLAIAALEATLAEYLRGDPASLPVLAMIRLTPAEIARRAENFAEVLRPLVTSSEAHVEIADGESLIGGGSTPDARLPTRLLQLGSTRWSPAQLERRLRVPEANVPVLAPVLARIAHDRLLLDLRTVFSSEEHALAASLAAALRAS
jgi:L-seryl-tRNA(Ser) seleniumtransferase